MKIRRGGAANEGKRVTVVAASARTSGSPVVEQGIAGYPETDAASGARYALNIEGTYETAFITSSVKGDRVDINDSSFALTRVAAANPSTAPGTGLRKFAQVVAVPGDGETADATKEPKTGKMWIELLPQQV